MNYSTHATRKVARLPRLVDHSDDATCCPRCSGFMAPSTGIDERYCLMCGFVEYRYIVDPALARREVEKRSIRRKTGMIYLLDPSLAAAANE